MPAISPVFQSADYKHRERDQYRNEGGIEVRHLESRGCGLRREGGRHSWWHNPSKNKRSAVPRHREVNDHLVRKICRELGIENPIDGA